MLPHVTSRPGITVTFSLRTVFLIARAGLLDRTSTVHHVFVKTLVYANTGLVDAPLYADADRFR